MLKTRLLVALFLASSTLVVGQTRNTYNAEADHNHYNIENWVNSQTIMVGTKFKHQSLINPNTHLMLLDQQGSIIWNKEYDFGVDERCLDVCVTDEVMTITGFVKNENNGKPKILVASFNSNGDMVASRMIDVSKNGQSVGLKIIYSKSQRSYYIAGYFSNDVKDAGAKRRGFLMKLNDDLGTVWTRKIWGNGVNEHYNFVNGITEIGDDGVVVTGQFANDYNNYPYFSSASMLVAFYDAAGNLVWDRSHENSNVYQRGADVVYDQKTDELFVLSNNSYYHTFEVSKISNVSTTNPVILYKTTNNIFSLYNANTAGFKIMIDQQTNELIVAGMIDRLTMTQFPSKKHTPSFIAKLDRNNFGTNSIHFFESYNEGISIHDVSSFQVFSGQGPSAFYADILTFDGGTNNFKLVEYTNNSGYIMPTLSIIDHNLSFYSSLNCNNNKSFTRTENENREHTVNSKNVPSDEEIVYWEEVEVEHDVNFGCSDPTSQGVTKKVKRMAVNSQAQTNRLSFSPNPTTNRITLSGFEKQIQLQITDMEGKVVLSQLLDTNESDVSSLAPGVYLLVARDETGNSLTERLVIKH